MFCKSANLSLDIALYFSETTLVYDTNPMNAQIIQTASSNVIQSM